MSFENFQIRAFKLAVGTSQGKIITNLFLVAAGVTSFA